ncbi:unnamed protein product, partial [Prorocentrum cordatum]
MTPHTTTVTYVSSTSTATESTATGTTVTETVSMSPHTTTITETTSHTTKTRTTYTYTYYTTTGWVSLASVEDGGDELLIYLLGGFGVAATIMLGGLLWWCWWSGLARDLFESLSDTFRRPLAELPAPRIVKTPFRRPESWSQFSRRSSAASYGSPAHGSV